MSATIQAGELYRVIWNALLFLDKNSPTGPVAEFLLEGEKITVRSSDAYSGIIERAWLDQPHMTTGAIPSRWYLPKENLQEIAKKLKVEPNETFQLMNLAEQDADITDEQAKAWQDLQYLSRYLRPLGEANGFAFSHDRLKLLYRVRPGGDYPIIFRMSELPAFADDDTESVVEFKIGPNIRGYVAPLDGINLTSDWRMDG